MLEPLDYKEPSCALCGGEEFYYPELSADKPDGLIPVDRIMLKLDGYLNRNEMTEAAKHLEYWRKEAKALKDKRGELSILSEMMGLYRKKNDKEKGMEAVESGIALLDALGLSDNVNGATILLNAATALKAFNKPERAIDLYKRAEIPYERDLSRDNPKRAGLYNNRALAYTDISEYETAANEYLKALSVLSLRERNENEIAITYINMAHLYEKLPSKTAAEITECLDRAYENLNSDKIPRDGYHAFVCDKCAPSFGYFGYFEEEKVLKNRAKELYARS